MASAHPTTIMVRKRILLLTDWFIPAYKAGGPIQSCANFAAAMSGEYDIYVLTGDTDLGETQPYVSHTNNWTGGMAQGIYINYLSADNRTYGQLKRMVENVRPDFIYLNHMFSPYFVLLPLVMRWLGQTRGIFVVSPRGALFDSALHYKNTFLKKIVVLKLMQWLGVCKGIRFHATTDEEEAAIRKFFKANQVIVASNLPPSTQFPLQKIEKKKGELKLIFIARIVPIKNLLLILEVLKTVSSRVVFTIVGPAEDGDYWNKCLGEIKKLPEYILVNYLGPKSNSELGEILRSHHLFILPSNGENFGHSIVESFLSGRPVLISDQTPWRTLEERKIGWDLSLSKPAGIRKTIEKAAMWDQNEFNEWASHAWNFGNSLIHHSDDVKKYEILFS